MKIILKIARMELQKMFYSPIAWLILIVFSIQAGIQVMLMIKHFVMGTELGYGFQSLTPAIYTASNGVFNQMQQYLYLYIPLLTMGLFSKEFSSGSIKLLYSSPITNTQIVLGKFFSMMFFGLAMVFILFNVALLGNFTIKDFDFSLAITAIFGLYLLICAYSAIGLFMSSLTAYQIVAAIGTFATLFVLKQVGGMWQDIEFVRDITYWLSIQGRSNTLINGLISSEDVLYFILISLLFIAFTIFRLKGIREKSAKYVSFLRYTGAFIITALIGYVSTIPSLMVYHDSTRTNTNTLTENSQKIISKLEGKISITTYANAFDQNFFFAMPKSQKSYMDIFKQYKRFYPNMDHEFKYYYALPVEKHILKSHNERYKGLTEIQALEKLCEIQEINIERFRSSNDYSNEINFQDELNRVVNKITTESGKTTNVRLFNDFKVVPTESEISAAFKVLVEKSSPIVGFVNGHEERDVDDFGSRGYNTLAKEKPFRQALINNGFDFKECNLSLPVDKDINILVIADSKTMYSEEELKNLNNYIDRGGNMVIACDLNRQNVMNPLVQRFGVSFMDGQIAEHNKGYTMDLITAVSTDKGSKLAYHFEDLKGEKVITMPGAVAISYEKMDGINYTPLFVSDGATNIKEIDSIGSWNELKTTDFIDDIAKYDPEEGDKLGSLTTALALTRKIGTKEQRIMILGDADCLSNGEISTNRREIRAENFKMASGIFFWLSDNKLPIDVRRPIPPDDKMEIGKKDLDYLSPLYKIIFPSLFGLAFLVLWLRRKGR
ncbi:Gldg family protein [Flavivirga sp. 57AJ16]|uniref:Gldg family protein n=1 Tax=Flavivirga sp. 57AJ16 TaxID=3025307 RepID=UPI0023665766|nr:Gldg family protein [Flavivirga sp. 57AJ16]MDD7887825.1 Gldg family protein [Flavivirga sp. 57AJ16]